MNGSLGKSGASVGGNEYREIGLRKFKGKTEADSSLVRLALFPNILVSNTNHQSPILFRILNRNDDIDNIYDVLYIYEVLLKVGKL